MFGATVGAAADMVVARVSVHEHVHNGADQILFRRPYRMVQAEFSAYVPLVLLVPNAVNSCLQLPVLVRASLFGRIPELDQFATLVFVTVRVLRLVRADQRVPDGHVLPKKARR